VHHDNNFRTTIIFEVSQWIYSNGGSLKINKERKSCMTNHPCSRQPAGKTWRCTKTEHLWKR